MLKGFKEFLLRGNVVDLAVAVVIGAAFNAVVTGVVDAVINPLISVVFQADSLNDALVVQIADAQLKFGMLIGALLNFVIVAAVVYFAFVMPMNKLRSLGKAEDEAAEEATESEQELLAEIRDLLKAQNATK